MGLVLGPHACTDRIWDTRVAEPQLPAPEDGRPGEGQRLTPDAPRNGGRHPRPQAKHAPDHRRWTQHTRSSGRWDSETAEETPHKRTRARTPTWRQYRSHQQEARPRNLRRRRAACPPSAPRGNGATAPAKAGAPNSTLSPDPMTERCLRSNPRPHAPPYATGWRRAGSWMRPHAAAWTSRRPSTESPTQDRRQWPCTPGAATADPQRGSLWSPGELCWSWRRTWSEGCSTHPVCSRRANSGPSRCTTPQERGPSPRGRCSPSCGTWHRRTPPQGPQRKSPGTSTPADQDYPPRRPRGGLPMAPAAEGLSLAATLQRHPDKRARHFLQTGTVPAAPPDSELAMGRRGGATAAGPLLWYLPMGTLAHATKAVKGAFPQPLLPGMALLRSLQAGAAWVRWREGGGRSSPYFPLVQGQALLHAEGMGTVEWGAIVPGTACRWITAAAPQPMRSPPACQRLLRMVSSLAPQTRLNEGRMEGHTEPHQGVANEPGCTVPAGAGAPTAHGPHTRGPPRPARGVGSHGAVQR